MNSAMVVVLSSCFQTSLSLSSCFLDKAMDNLNEALIVLGTLFLTGNSQGVAAMLSMSLSDHGSVNPIQHEVEPKRLSYQFFLCIFYKRKI